MKTIHFFFFSTDGVEQILTAGPYLLGHLNTDSLALRIVDFYRNQSFPIKRLYYEPNKSPESIDVAFPTEYRTGKFVILISI